VALRENFETPCTLLAYQSIRDQYTPFVIRNSSKATERKVHKTHYFVCELLTNHFPISGISPKPVSAERLLMDICISSIMILIFILLLQAFKL
jgi:hypothetical protein